MPFPHDSRKKIKIRGVTYPSVRDAAAALSITEDAIRKARTRGALDTVGLNPRGKHHTLPVTIGKRTYPSIPRAVKATKRSYWELRRLALQQKNDAPS